MPSPYESPEAKKLIFDRLCNDYIYHKPKPGQPELYQELRARAHDLAHDILRHVPVGRERSLALTKIEEAIFWAHAGIARHG